MPTDQDDQEGEGCAHHSGHSGRETGSGGSSILRGSGNARGGDSRGNRALPGIQDSSEDMVQGCFARNGEASWSNLPVRSGDRRGGMSWLPSWFGYIL